MQDKCREVSPQYAGMKIAEKVNDLVGNCARGHFTSQDYWQKVGVQ